MSANKPPARTAMKFEAQAFDAAALASETQLTVFLAGPYIETTGIKPGDGEEHRPHRLRFNLFHQMSDSGFVVTMGEFGGLVSAVEPALKKRTDAAVSEIVHARKYTDGIVMLPSSAGSFLELGAFALYKDLCEKMIIIIDKKFESDEPNYLNQGTIPGAKKYGATVHYIDYQDTTACWTTINEFLDEQRSRVIEERLLAR